MSSPNNGSAGDSNQSRNGLDALKQHILEHKIEMALWSTRVLTMFFTLGYFIPIFGNPYNAYNKALIANAATSALRLHQRQPHLSFTRAFVHSILMEDSFHYLSFSLIFLYVGPFTLTLLPIFLFSLIHFASYSLTLLDTLGQNSWWGARLLISLVEFQSRNILCCIACAEILLLPFTVILVIVGRAGLLTPVFYYHFVLMRYGSLRNPYTRNMFRELRLTMERLAAAPVTPGIVKQAILKSIDIACKLGPAIAQESSQ